MLRLALAFLIIALLAGLFSFGLLANMAYAAAQIVFFLFLALAFVALLGSALRGNSPTY
jgi:uncharacterized membrane protein YtjA (UPF0391 family)